MIRRSDSSRFDKRHRSRVVASLLLLAVVAGAAALQAQAEGIPGFTPIGDYVVAIDDVDRKAAEIFGAQQARALLILSSDLPSPVMISLANGSVSGLHLMKVAKRSNGTVDLLPNPVAQGYGLYSIDGDRIQFDVGGRRVVVKPKPVLTGNKAGADLVAYDPAYAVRRDGYDPSAEAIETLREFGEEVRVRIYFGTWCPFCAEMVPRVLKIADQLEGSKIQFEYYGLPRRINDDAEARAMSIQGVPTGIIYKGGREIGRISGNSWRTPEQAIIDLIGAG